MPKGFRINVAALIVQDMGHGTCKLLMGQRRDYPGCWQWPQGGVDPGESLETALRREVKEETGLSDLVIVHWFSEPIRYHFKRSNRKRFKRFLGQEQHYAILKVKSTDPGLARLNEVSNKEFKKLKWKKPHHAVATAPKFKKKAYKKAARQLGVLLRSPLIRHLLEKQ